MKNPPGYGSIVDLGKNRRKPIAVRVPNGKKLNKQGKEVINYKYLGYFERSPQGKKDAAILLAQYNDGIAVNLPSSIKACPTFKELSNIWLERCLTRVETKKGKVSHQLEESYMAAINRCKSIHNTPINKIKLQDVQDIADSAVDKSQSTVRNLETVLNGAFDLARRQKMIPENFINDVDFIYKTSKDKIHKSFTREEIDLLWKNKDDANVRIVLMMVYTGLRIEELLSLQTESVFLSEKYIIGGVKTDAGINRIVPLADKILPFISELYNQDNTYLLTHKKKRFKRATFLKQIWNPVMEKMNMDNLPHDTRYTCATLMDRAEINKNCQKAILGHEQDGVTDKVYIEKDLQDLLCAINRI